MKRRNIWICTSAIVASAIAVGGMLPAQAAGIDWSKIKASEITLFYPGQGSWEWMVNAKHKAGATETRDGKNCLDCHEGEEADIGNLIASGKKLEPKPIAGKAGTLKLTMQAAFDSDYLYLKASWPAKAAGRYHDYIMFKDGKWGKYGSHQTSSKVTKGGQPAAYEDRFSVMLGDGKGVPEFANAGCWVTCHNDMRFMPDHPKKDAVIGHPVLGKTGLHKKDIRKYLLKTRTKSDETGGWANTRSADENKDMRAKGTFLDLWQWRAHRSNPVNMADDGFVSQYRLFDAGKKMFGHNWDKKKKQPKFMFDPAKNGGKPGLAMSDINNPASNYYLGDGNKVAYDPAYGWKDGDILVRRIVTSKTKGSAGDNNDVRGVWADGRWTLVWKRKLNTGNAMDDITLKSGMTYPIGIAIHDDHTTARWHYVSFPLKLSLGKNDGQINAVALK